MRRSFLFLQGPHGPFFHKLGRLLKEERHRVTRINFNGGDVFDWTGSDTIAFRERAEVWPFFLADFLHKYTPTDLVTFGDCRPVLETGLRIAKSFGARCHVFEEGYIRPDWITLELNGVNGKSTLPRDPEWFREKAKGLPEKVTIKLRSNVMVGMMYHVGAYYAAKCAAKSFFPHFRSHRPYCEWTEARHWALKLLMARNHAKRGQNFQNSFLASRRQFFLFCLQLGSDSQISRHSPFSNMKSAIVKVLASFAAKMKDGTSLVVKNHPLDSGIARLDLFTFEVARRLGIENRVFFTQGGVLDDYIKASRGVIVINSTVGMSSLHHHRPTIALGRAIYAIPGLVNCCDLDDFWSSPEPPDESLYRAFRTVLLHKTQMNGSFYTEEGMRSVLPLAVERLLANDYQSGVAMERERVLQEGQRLSLGIQSQKLGTLGRLCP